MRQRLRTPALKVTAQTVLAVYNLVKVLNPIKIVPKCSVSIKKINGALQGHSSSAPP